MTPVTDSTATLELDNAPNLPPQNRRSLVLVLAVQALNSFNDNFVKMLLVAFAIVAAKGTNLGDNFQIYLGIIFSIPYILFAPLAGFLSDRYSKQRVILWMQISQVLIFGWFIWALSMRDINLSLMLSLLGFFLIATQAAFFGPAKMGVMKDLAGSRRLGSVSGWLQMTMFAGILSGIGFAGPCFKALNATWGDPWKTTLALVLVVSALAVLQVVGSLFVHRTPEHRDLRFKKEVLWEHFIHLKLLFAVRPIRLAAFGVAYFWFSSNSVITILVALSKETFPTDAGLASQMPSLLGAMLGVGVVSGSLVASIWCRKKIELGLVPLACIGMGLGILWAGLTPLGSKMIYASMVLIGGAGGIYMTPLYAFIQDMAKPEERARILSSVNLLDCSAGILANAFVKVLMMLHLSSSNQLLVLVIPSIAAAMFITKLLPRNVVRLLASSLIRTVYRVTPHHSGRMPMDGSVLVLANHTSYADALILGATCERDVRFVMFDTLYKIKTMNWFFVLFGTVPISPTKAKEAIRTVADVLKDGKAVALYPEGQLTRSGFFNELQKGYELMARLGGNAKVQPVWIDGLWGSIFSFEGGRFFRKMPRLMRYPTSVWFGETIEARAATPAKVREAMLALSAEAFANRISLRKALKIKLPEDRILTTEQSRTAQVNALRVLETCLLHEGDVILCLLKPEHPMAQTFGCALSTMRNVEAFWNIADVKKKDGQRVIAILDAATSQQASESWDFAVHVQGTAEATTPVVDGDKNYPALFDSTTGALLTLSVPNPEMPKGDEDNQHGRKPGSVGHLLAGISLWTEDNAIVLGSVQPGSSTPFRLENAMIDEEGFVYLKPATGGIPV